LGNHDFFMLLAGVTASPWLAVAWFHLFYAPMAATTRRGAASECQHAADPLAGVKTGFSALIL